LLLRVWLLLVVGLRLLLVVRLRLLRVRGLRRCPAECDRLPVGELADHHERSDRRGNHEQQADRHDAICIRELVGFVTDVEHVDIAV
jgi:hypothetical protein